MGIIRLTLITVVLIWGAMYFFGRDDGVPENRLGRTPTQAEGAPAPAEDVAAEPAAPSDVTTAPQVAEPIADVAEDEPEAPETLAETPPAPEEPELDVEPAPVAGPVPDPAPEPPAEPEVTLYVSGRVVNVRSGPSTSFDAITSLQRGAPVIDLGDVGDGWRRIRLPSGDFGYMSGDFLSPDPQ